MNPTHHPLYSDLSNIFGDDQAFQIIMSNPNINSLEEAAGSVNGEFNSNPTNPQSANAENVYVSFTALQTGPNSLEITPNISLEQTFEVNGGSTVFTTTSGNIILNGNVSSNSGIIGPNHLQASQNFYTELLSMTTKSAIKPKQEELEISPKELMAEYNHKYTKEALKDNKNLLSEVRDSLKKWIIAPQIEDITNGEAFKDSLKTQPHEEKLVHSIIFLKALININNIYQFIIFLSKFPIKDDYKLQFSKLYDLFHEVEESVNQFEKYRVADTETHKIYIKEFSIYLVEKKINKLVKEYNSLKEANDSISPKSEVTDLSNNLENLDSSIAKLFADIKNKAVDKEWLNLDLKHQIKIQQSLEQDDQAAIEQATASLNSIENNPDGDTLLTGELNQTSDNN